MNSMKIPIFCVILGGIFLLGTVALHAYLTPVFGGTGEFIYMSRCGRTYLLNSANGFVLDDRDGRFHRLTDNSPVP